MDFGFQIRANDYGRISVGGFRSAYVSEVDRTTLRLPGPCYYPVILRNDSTGFEYDNIRRRLSFTFRIVMLHKPDIGPAIDDCAYQQVRLLVETQVDDIASHRERYDAFDASSLRRDTIQS